MDEKPAQRLIHKREESYGESFTADLLEQYKLYVQSADNASGRRIASNRYLLTLNAALVAAYGFQSAFTEQVVFVAPLAVAGIALSLLWYSTIKSFRDLNSIKFKIIHEMETYLPAALYAYEWQLAEEGRGKSYWPTTHIEKWMPILFLVLHGMALAVSIAFAIYGLPDWAK
ncbi:MAG: hypothetical protein OXC99_00965 [Chloroflexi bacterium]|nr:hypothetical protein [Chloroflexota bacterium]